MKRDESFKQVPQGGRPGRQARGGHDRDRGLEQLKNEKAKSRPRRSSPSPAARRPCRSTWSTGTAWPTSRRRHRRLGGQEDRDLPDEDARMGGKVVDCIRIRHQHSGAADGETAAPAEAGRRQPTTWTTQFLLTELPSEPPQALSPPPLGANPMIRTALALARRGLHVFPCLPRGKEPATAHGCKDATTDADTIRQWWREQPDYNVAVATGAASKMFVLDVDGLDAECELRKLEAEHGELPPSVEVDYSRGRHIWLRYPDRPVKNTAGKIAPGIDTRGDGGYVLAPPSVHPSGRAYAWSVDCAKAIAAAPDWLIEKIAARPTATAAAADTAGRMA